MVSLVMVWLKTWVMEPDHRIRLILALDRRGIRDLVGIAPPETNRELLHFALVVVTDKDFGCVADVVIAANGPLAIVLVEYFRLGVVVAASGVGICVSRRIQLG